MTKRLRVLGVIPARAQSSRFPFKVLAEIQKKPMIQWVWENARRSAIIDELVIATDHPEVRSAAVKFGAEVVMTPPELASGTDRVHWVARERQADLVLNIQGDEPLLPVEALDTLIHLLERHPETGMATLAVEKNAGEGMNDPNVVKVTVSDALDALYFSRAPLAGADPDRFLKHLGIYGFRFETLGRFCSLSQGKYEKAERLEQLRALENGIGIKVGIIAHDTLAVDVPGDIAKVEARMKQLGVA